MKANSLFFATIFGLLALPCHGQDPALETTPKQEGKAKANCQKQRPGQARFAALWKKLDTDADGFLSRAEFDQLPRLQKVEAEKRDRLFQRLDRNKDGKVGRRELALLILGKQMQQRLWSLDTDHSGGVSFVELQAGEHFKKLPPAKQQEVFRKLDRNGDGVISPLDRPKQAPKGHKPKKPAKQGGGNPQGATE